MNEEQLLLWIGGNYPGEAKALFCTETFDWNGFMKLAYVHQLIPRVYQKLKTFGPMVPSAISERLRNAYLATTSLNLRLAHRSNEVINRFNHAGVPVIPLKGVHFAELVQGDIGLRPTTDIDLLVKEEDLGRVTELLGECGYRPLDKGYSEDFGQHGRHRPYVREGAGVGYFLEVHWNFYLAQPRKLDMMPVWQRAIRRRFNGCEIYTLAPADLVFYLAIQQRLHGYRSLKLYADLTETIVRFPDVDWHHIIKQADAAGQRTGLYFALRFAALLLRAPVPASVMKELRPVRMRTWLVERFINRKTIIYGRHHNSVKIFFDWMRMLTNDSLLDTVRIVGRLGTTYSTDIAQRYGLAAGSSYRLLKTVKKVVHGIRN